jgi:sec-independent protein translocase protein TatB
MFDIGISELGVIGVVALIVIGPERLPKVARTVGTLLGRAQRYVSDVKAEVSREMQLDELRKMKESVEQSAQSVQSSLRDEIDKTQSELTSAWSADADVRAAPAENSRATGQQGVSSVKRSNWRRKLSAKKSATPLGFRDARRKRLRVASGAARVARYRAKNNFRTTE